MRNCLPPCLPPFTLFLSTPKNPREIKKNPREINDEALKCLDLGKIDEAKKLFEKSIKLYEKKEDNKSLAIVYSNLASLHIENNDYDQAINCYEKSQQYFEKDGLSLFDIPKVKLKIASCYCEKGKLTQASSFIESALEIGGDKLNIYHPRILFDIYRDAGDLYKKMQSKYIESLTQQQQSITGHSSLLENQNRVENPQIFTLQSQLAHTDNQIPNRTENTQQGSENNYFLKHIDCLQKAIDFSCIQFLKEDRMRIFPYDTPNRDDENNFLIICSSIEEAFNETHNLIKNHKLNAELGDKYKIILMESLDKLIDVSINETVAISFKKLVVESSLIYERLTPFFKDTEIGTKNSSSTATSTATSPRRIEVASSTRPYQRTETPRRNTYSEGAGVFNSPR